MNPPAALFTRLSFFSYTFFACIVLCGWSPPATAQTGKVALAFPVNALTVDEDLADWPTDLIRYPLLHNDAGAPLLGPADFQGYFVVAYNETENALYVGTDIQDDSVVRQGDKGEPWDSQDSCELYLFGHKPGQHNPTQYSIRGEWPPSIFGSGSLDEMQTAVGWRQDGYSCERRIDLTRASGGQVRLQPDIELGFDLSVWDRDLEGPASWIAWSRGIDKYRRSDRLGTLAVMRANARLDEILEHIGTISDKRDHLPNISGSAAGYQMFSPAC